MSKTIFEKIIDREIPSKIICETEHSLAFLDIAPISIGHTLVIPKKPYKDLYEVPENVLADMMALVKKVAITLKKTFNADGINLLNNNEKAAGQVVFHYHIHIVPRFEGDKMGYNFPHNEVSNETLDEWHSKILKTIK